MATITAFPLQWPSGWPRSTTLEQSRFKTTLSDALAFLRKEVELMGGKNLVLSSNCALGHERPKDPGVVAYFNLLETPIAMPCDRWLAVEDNVKAIGLTIEAMRGMERWGAKHMITAIFKGFKALPERSGPSCWEVLGLQPGSSEAEILTAWRKKASAAHPDTGGSHKAMTDLNEAKDLALSTVRHQ